jgi:hypothetical protein
LLIPSSFTDDTAFIYMQQIRHSQHPHHSPLPAGRNFSRLTVRTLLRPADLLASLTDPTLLALCRLRLLLRSFRSEESLSLPSGMTTVVTGQVLLAGSPPAGLAASFAALHVVSLACAGSIDYAGPDNHSRITRLPHCLPPTRHGVGILIYRFFEAQSPRPPMPPAYASSDTSRCRLQD